MPELSDFKKPPIPLFVLVAAGLAGNYFKFTVFLNIDFLFGSIFAMLALQFFGLTRGIIAAAAIGSYTYFLWNHPYACLILIAETALVGLLMQRRRFGMVAADAVYWIVVGMPLVYLFYHGVMQVPLSNTYIVMTKQAMNGIANAIIARLLFTGFALRSKSVRIPFGEMISSLLAGFVLVPSLILLAIGCRSEFADTDRMIREGLTQDIGREAKRLETWVKSRKAPVVQLAVMAASLPPQQLQPFLEQAARSDSNFKRMGLLDKGATTIAFYPLTDEMGQNNIGKNFADRPFIPKLQQTLKPMLSEVVMGRIGVPQPVVSVLAPVVTEAGYNGYVIGVLSLQQVKDQFDKASESSDILYTLLDKNGKVIMSNRPGQKTMAPLQRGKGTLKSLPGGITQWVPVSPPNTPVSERWKKSYYGAEAAVGDFAEWKLILEQPVAPFQKKLHDSYTGKLTILFAILLMSLALADFLSRRIMATIENLRKVTSDLPSRLASGGSVDWPKSGITETDNLIVNFKEMSDSIKQHLADLQRLNDSLEQRVEERTREVERLASEQRTILSTMPLGACLLKNRVIQRTNPAFDRIVGYDPGETLGKDTAIFYVDQAWYQSVGEAGYGALQRGEIYSTDLKMKRKDGSVIWCNVAGQMVNPEAAEDGSIWIIQDITERKQAAQLEQQLLHAQKLESLGVLAGGIAHDFNNILMAIMGNAELGLMRMPDGAAAAENLHRIQQSAQRAADLTKHMLAYSGKGRFMIEAVDLNQVIEELAHLQEISVSRQAKLSYHLHRPLPAIDGDPAQLRQMVMNLVINASEAIGGEKGEIVITTGSAAGEPKHILEAWQEELPEGEYVCLTVTDTGCGMDRETIARLFDPFFTTKFTGRGLGMAAVQGIVKGHKGAIRITSEPGKGSTFRIFLPVGTPTVKGDVGSTDRQREAMQPGAKAMLVDDEEAVRNVGAEMLKQLGFTPVLAKDGEEALEIFRQTPGISFLILDMTMPRMDGKQCLGELRRIAPAVPVIMSSGYNEQEIARELGGEIPSGFIQKPYNVASMKEAIERALRR
ncbi:response regulator [Geomonas terrae]|uniref:histidine kinase n=1 Tax=Geomonas terrae TaxID=2562681 RepID=A0A4S1CAD8_9BACT|nr:ATP-binding protein [Geomonas terrae]TGU70267.1 response regulator [Geomonas terrae]